MASSRAVRAHGGLSVSLAADGGVGAVACGRKRLPLAGPGGFSIRESIMPRGEVRELGRVAGRVVGRGGALRFSGGIRPAGLELKATVKGGRYVDVRGEVRDLTGVDRALMVTFTLPLKLAGWKWENTAATSRVIRRGKVYPGERRDFLYMGKTGDHFADEDHAVYPIRINKLPFSCVSKGRAGLAVACPLHEPRVFLIEASEAGYSISFSLGVTPITRKFPSRAWFRLVIFPVDPAWGIRSACERYQGFFPELFRTRMKRHGHLATVFNPERRPPHPHMDDMGYVCGNNDYQWTGGEIPKPVMPLLEKLGINPRDTFHWRGPWYWFHEAPGDITPDEQLALLKAQAEGRARGAHGANNQLCGCPEGISARGSYNSYIENAQGKLERIRFQYPKVSCWLMPGNMDPNLPAPNKCTLAVDWQFRYLKLRGRKGYRGPFGVAYDALDDFSGFRRLNFRRSHLAVMDIPATFDPRTGRVCQVKGFHDWAWARYHVPIVHQGGGKVLANVNLEHSMMYLGQFLDVIERERNPARYDEERLSTQRMLVGAMPIAFPGGKWIAQDRKGWTREARKVMLFGMPPGAVIRRWRELREHMPLVSAIGEAGWRAVPHARAKGLWIERFGGRPGRLYLTVRNCGRRARRSQLDLDLAALGLGDRRVKLRQISPERELESRRRGGKLLAALSVPPRETVVLKLVRG
jgi:hypothetical protein